MLFDPIPRHPDVELVSDDVAWSGRFRVDVVKFRQRRFDGSMSGLRTWEVFRRGRAAALLPYDPITDQVVLIEQFRLPALVAGLEPVLVEVPAGLCEPGEQAEATVRRETVEEIGLQTGRIEQIGDFILTPGGSDERCVVFVGEVLAPQSGPGGVVGTGGLAAENEDIRARVWPADAAIAEAVAGRFPNSITAIALLWLATRKAWLRAHWGVA